MPKPLPRGQPDPMAREVDRLLAQLLGADPSQRGDRAGQPRSNSTARPAIAVGIARTEHDSPVPTRGELIGLWARVLLGVALGGLMTQWPYPRDCGWPLLGYLAAVAAVILAGAWIAFTSWTLRGGVAHLLALILAFWGIVLFAEQLLPRIGYAVDRATWWCTGEPVPAWLAQLGGF